ncbi:MAG TPA: SDR family oxidoreductase [Gemmatimonadales bacterium]
MILVLGAGGHVGTPLVEDLAARGARFRAGYRTADRAAAAERLGAETVLLDYLDADSLDRAMAGVERLFLVAPPVENLEQLERAVVEAAIRNGVPYLVKLSVWDARTGDFIFGRPHRAIEELVERSGLAWTFLRPNGFMQNLLASAPLIRQSGVHPFPEGGRVSWVDARDVGRAAAAVLTGSGHEGRAYELSGPERLGYADQIRIVSEVTGRDYAYVPLPDEEWRRAALGAGLPPYLVNALVDLQRYQRKGHTDHIADGVERLTGAQPTTFRRFVEDHVEAFR